MVQKGGGIMTATRIKDIIGPIEEEIGHLTAENTDVNILRYVESQLAFDKVRNFLEKYSNVETEANIQFLKVLCEFLCDRWCAIKRTDAIYSHNSHSIGNRAYIILAERVAKIFSLNHYHLLMPNVGAISYITSRDNLSCFKFHEFVLGDDGTPIEVALCLNEAFNNKTTALCHTSHAYRLLSRNEKERIIHHSDLTYAYYQAIKALVKYNLQFNSDVANEFNLAITADTYKASPTYGEPGQIKLATTILSMVKNRMAFVGALATFVPSSRWEEFLRYMPTKELTELILEDYPLINSLQKVNTYTGDIIYDKAMLFCFLEIYARQQFDDDLFDSLIGQLAYYTKASFIYSKEQKKEGIKLLKDFLTSQEELIHLKDYVKQKAEKEADWRAIFGVGSSLSLIAGQINRLCEPDFFTKKKVNYPIFFF